jgi:hypothetical protein
LRKRHYGRASVRRAGCNATNARRQRRRAFSCARTKCASHDGLFRVVGEIAPINLNRKTEFIPFKVQSDMTELLIHLT